MSLAIGTAAFFAPAVLWLILTWWTRGRRRTAARAGDGLDDVAVDLAPVTAGDFRRMTDRERVAYLVGDDASVFVEISPEARLKLMADPAALVRESGTSASKVARTIREHRRDAEVAELRERLELLEARYAEKERMR
jgi:hypothetical protein